jgi:nucleoside-diphosphate-sugar epimerase
MSLHVIVGSGLIGSTTAGLLAGAGEKVRILTRRGTGPEHPAIERVAADATDTARLRELTAGAAALYNCANPPYHRWPTDWPPLHQAMLGAAEATGAVLVITSNLYGYGPVDRPMTEDMPLAATSVKGRVRAEMWRSALTAHEAGRVRVTEARGSDYLGPGAQSMLSERVVPGLLAGKTVQVPANLDAPHSFTYTADMARTLVTIAADERAWGKPWHVPSNPPMTVREVTAALARIAGLPMPKVTRVPDWLLWTAGVFVPGIREFREVAYQFREPFVLDSSLATRTFGLEPTPMDEALRATIDVRRARPAPS